MLGMELYLGYWTTYSLVAVTTVLLLYWYSIKNRNFWKDRGVKSDKQQPFVVTLFKLFRRPFFEFETERYLKYGTIYGYFEGNEPLLSVAEPSLLRDIFVKDFSNFPSRRVFESGDETADSVLIMMKGGENWKRIRSIITPTFSTGKIKRMLSILKECSQTVVENFEIAAKEGKPIDAKKFYGAYTMDAIASTAFSTKLDSHREPDNPFVKAAQDVFKMKLNWKVLLFFFFPRILKLFKARLLFPEAMDFFGDITHQIIEERKRTGKVGNDFLQLLMDTAKEVTDDETTDSTEKEGDIATNYGLQEDINPHLLKAITSKNLSMTELVGQCVTFFVAGYDTTATTISLATYHLALDQDIQQKLRNEVDEVLNEHNGELTYGAIQEMKYLDNVLSETLRLYPPLSRLERTCEADYTLGETGITVPKGTCITIPIWQMHRDSKNFPNPERFDPDRFTPEERAKRHPYSYLPFGTGPRGCVAMRFALVEMKVCLTYVISHFIIKTSAETKIPVEFQAAQGLLQPIGIILNIETRKDSPLKSTRDSTTK